MGVTVWIVPTATDAVVIVGSILWCWNTYKITVLWGGVFSSSFFPFFLFQRPLPPVKFPSFPFCPPPTKSAGMTGALLFKHRSPAELPGLFKLEFFLLARFLLIRRLLCRKKVTWQTTFADGFWRFACFPQVRGCGRDVFFYSPSLVWLRPYRWSFAAKNKVVVMNEKAKKELVGENMNVITTIGATQS